MISGTINRRITTKDILSKISPYDIYRYFCPVPFTLNRSFRSPFPTREDSTPSCIIGTRSGELTHIDFGDKSYRGDCFDFVQQIRMLSSLDQVIRVIDREFGLGFYNEPIKDYQKEILGKYQQPVIEEKKPSHIIVVERDLNEQELAYWAGYYQSAEDLRREKIYGVKQLYFNRKRLALPKGELIFAYQQDDRFKIYRPECKDKKKKWFPNNIPNNQMEGLSNLVPGKKALILGSRKDRLVAQKIFPHCGSTQNESIMAFTPQDLEYIKKNSIEQWIGYDSDTTGKMQSREITENFGFRHINVPDQYLEEGIKDFADWAKHYGLKAVEDHFRLKGLLD